MRIRIFAALVLIISASSALASWKANWIFGGSVSYGERLGNVDTTMIYTHPNSFNVPNAFIRDQFVNTGELLGLLGGYQIQCRRFVFGLEASFDWDNVDEHYLYAFADSRAQVGQFGIAFNADSHYKRDVTVSLTTRWGYHVSRFFMPYLRFGFESSRDHLDVAFFGIPGIYNFNTQIEDSHRQYRYLLGVGGEMSMAQFDQFGLRLEYNFHSKGERLLATGAIYDNAQFNPLFFAQTKPKMHSVKLSLVWNFDI